MGILAKRGDVEFDTLIPWIVGAVVLIIVVIGYFYLSGAGKGFLETLKNTLRFG